MSILPTVFRRLTRSELAIGILEIAIGLPLLLGLLFALFWAAIYTHARITLTTAVPDALQSALTRGDTNKAGSTFITALDCFYYFRHGSDGYDRLPMDPALCGALPIGGSYWGALGEIMYLNNAVDGDGKTVTDPDAALATYDSSAPFCSNTAIDELSRTYIYTLAYINGAVSRSLGSSVRYPCDPNRTDGNNCLQCTFELPKGFDPTNTTCEDGRYDTGSTWESFEQISIQCSYRPSNALIKPAIALLGSNTDSSAFGVITVEAHS